MAQSTKNMFGKKTKTYKVIDLFSGVGGLSNGFKKAGFEIISANEYDPKIAFSYSKNHPTTKMIVSDISKINSSALLVKNDAVDVIVGGPPCQGFSMSGKRIRANGAFLDDPRNELFKEFFRVVKDLKPKVFLIENVASILNIHNGEIKKKIFNLFESINYKLHVKVLIAADYGVPQLRKRAVFIGTNLNIDPKKLFPKKTHGLNTSKQHVTVEESIFDLPKIQAGGGSTKSKYNQKPKNSYQKERRRNTKILHNHKASTHDKKIIEIMKKIKEGNGRESLPLHLQTNSVHSGSYGRMDRNKPAYTITTRFDTPPVGRVTHPYLNRTITPREAARIQSFDDDFIFYGNKSSIGKQIGNAVPPLLAYAIANKIITNIKKND